MLSVKGGVRGDAHNEYGLDVNFALSLKGVVELTQCVVAFSRMELPTGRTMKVLLVQQF